MRCSQGSSSSSSQSSIDESADGSSTEALDVETAVSAASQVFGLGKRELQRAGNQLNVEDLACRQVATVLASVTPSITASDLRECGGDLAARLHEASGLKVGLCLFAG